MRLLALLLPLLLAGCLGEVALGTARDPTFRFVEIVSDFRAEREENVSGVCGFASFPTVDADARTVTFPDHDDMPPADPGVLVLQVTWDRTYCGVARSSYFTSARWNGSYPLGSGSIELRDDGALAVHGVVVPTGGERTFEDHGTLPDGRPFNQTYTVRDHGAWPTSGLRVASEPSEP